MVNILVLRKGWPDTVPDGSGVSALRFYVDAFEGQEVTAVGAFRDR